MDFIRRKSLEILNRAFVVDMHMDIGIELEKQRKKGYTHVLNNDYLEEFKAGGVNLVIAAIFIENEDLPHKGLHLALRQVSAILKDIEECKENFIFCKDINDINKARKDKKIGIFISLEGLEPVEDDLELLNVFYKLGVRGMGLVWSRRNAVGDGCTFEPVKRGAEGGLTEFGVKVLEFAKEKKMIVDISHLNDIGIEDVLKLSDYPIIASHSNAREIYNIKRNLTDDQLRKIASKGGIVGINAAKIIAGDKKTANMKDLFKHIDYIKNLIGSEHLGLGLDLCDKLIRHGVKEVPKNGMISYDVLNTHKDIVKLVDMMVEKGYDDGEIENILGKSFLRVLERIMG
ncbi:dipeptidase [Maledivibacter halophilus]|uniref:Membrane dipeptidase n=1 Tax=Maledivibacter halophilus TaxID=36842 RepID=A0A1T5ME31_9FIRM|nr:membrane dipeptidase [Maledivibacter halophilus]SKC86139.1 membrane dipeptidase [Maledivibacter halophilus]